MRMAYIEIKKIKGKALENLNRTLELNPNMVSAYAIRAALRLGKNDVEGALADLDCGIGIGEKSHFDLDLRSMPELYKTKAQILIFKGDSKCMEEAVQQSVRASMFVPLDLD